MFIVLSSMRSPEGSVLGGLPTGRLAIVHRYVLLYNLVKD